MKKEKKKKLFKFGAIVLTTATTVLGIYKAIKYYCYDSGIEELKSYGYGEENKVRED